MHPNNEHQHQPDNGEEHNSSSERWLERLRSQLPPPAAPPDGYFQQLPDALWQRIQQENAQQTKNDSPPRGRWRWFYLSAAAAVVLLLFGALSRWSADVPSSTAPLTQSPADSSGQRSEPSYSAALADLSDEEIEAYLLENSDEIALSDLQAVAADKIDSLYAEEYSDLLYIDEEEGEHLF